MKNKAINKILSLLLTMAMVFTLMPGVTASAVNIGTTDISPALSDRMKDQSGNDKDATISSSNASVSSPTLAQSTTAWFGGYQWVIIGWDGAGVASEAGTATLLFANANATKSANISFGTTTPYSNEYAVSDLRTAMAEFYDTITDARETNAIAPRSLNGESENYSFVNNEPINVASFSAAVGNVGANTYITGLSLQPADTFDWYTYHALRTRDADFIGGAAYNGAYHPNNVAGNGTSGDYFWPLSVAEASLLDGSIRSYSATWWLRSPGNMNNNAAFVYSVGNVMAIGSSVYIGSYSVRPAFKLDLSSVIFTSDASGASAKSSAALGGGLVGAAAPPGAVKLTILDEYAAGTNESGQKTPTLTFAQSTDGTGELRFGYTGASTGANQYVSCVLTDSGGDVAYYGQLADCATDASGTLAIPLAGVADGTYTLKIFCEQANGDYFTDFAGVSVDMTLTVSGGSGTVSGFSGTQDNTMPTVASVTPANSASGVATGGNIAITFDEAMNTAAGVGTVSLTGGAGAVNAPGVWSGGNTIYTIGYSGLAYNTAYTIDISGFQDVAGNVMAAGSSSFTTRSAPSSGGGSYTPSYTISFNANGGSAVSSKSVTSGGKLAKPTDPVKDGYAFAGWYTDAECTQKYDFEAKVTKALTLYAKWALPFKDVAESAWYYDAVADVYGRGLMLGTAEDMFSPDATLSRAMIVTILYRNAGEPSVAGLNNPFNDVAEGQWYSDAIKWAAANGIVEGYGNGIFGTNDPVTKEQLAALLYRTQQAGGKTPASVGGASIPDADKVSDWAKAAVNALNAQGIFSDIPGTEFNPQAPATRAEIASMLHRFL